MVFIRELINFLVQTVQFRIVNMGIAMGFLPSGQFVETDIEDVCDFDNHCQIAGPRRRFPSGCRRGD